MTEHDAISAVKAGDVEAFEVLYFAHKRRVYSLCLRMLGSPTTAEDLTQESFLHAFRRIQSFRGDSAFSTWLHRIAVNTVLMFIRQSKSRIGLQLSIEDLNVNEDESPRETLGMPDPKLTHSLDRLALLHAIEQLAPGYRIVFVLHDIEGYNHMEIAEMLGCSVGNTKSQLHKARLRMRALLRGEQRGLLEDTQEFTRLAA